MAEGVLLYKRWAIKVSVCSVCFSFFSLIVKSSCYSGWEFMGISIFFISFFIVTYFVFCSCPSCTMHSALWGAVRTAAGGRNWSSVALTLFCSSLWAGVAARSTLLLCKVILRLCEHVSPRLCSCKPCELGMLLLGTSWCSAALWKCRFLLPCSDHCSRGCDAGRVYLLFPWGWIQIDEGRRLTVIHEYLRESNTGVAVIQGSHVNKLKNII